MEENQPAATPAKKSKNSMLIIGIVIAVVVVVGGLLLLGGRKTNPPASEKATSSEPSSDSVSVEAANFAFTPNTITVKAGGTISFTNNDSASHSITADDGASFDSGLVASGQTTTVTAPLEPGEYPFHCSAHTSMKGTLIVE